MNCPSTVDKWISDMILPKESRLYLKWLSRIFLKKINYYLNNFK